MKHKKYRINYTLLYTNIEIKIKYINNTINKIE